MSGTSNSLINCSYQLVGGFFVTHMKEIQLTQGRVALVDDEDYAELIKYKWCAAAARKQSGHFYAVSRINGKQISMHRFLMKPKRNQQQIDHRNGNGLDNQKKNLRFCTIWQNSANGQHRKNNTSGYRGVTWDKEWGGWDATIWHKGKGIFIGTFKTKEHAAMAYDLWSLDLRGDFAQTNFKPVCKCASHS